MGLECVICWFTTSNTYVLFIEIVKGSKFGWWGNRNCTVSLRAISTSSLLAHNWFLTVFYQLRESYCVVTTLTKSLST